MDKALVELVEGDGAVFGDGADVWQPFTADAKAEYPGEEFIISGGNDLFPGCVYLGKLREIRASIAKMREVSHA